MGLTIGRPQLRPIWRVLLRHSAPAMHLHKVCRARVCQRVSLPMLTTIADCCGCKISDILLGKHVKLQKKHANADGYTVVGHPRGAHRFATSDALVAALQGLDELGLFRSLNQACRLLDMNQNTFRRLAPDVAALLVRRGQEFRHREKLAREERRFSEYWKCFQEMLVKNIRPTREKVQARMSPIRGTCAFECNRFHRKALALANLSRVRFDENQEKPLAKNRVGSKTINSCRKRHQLMNSTHCFANTLLGAIGGRQPESN